MQPILFVSEQLSPVADYLYTTAARNIAVYAQLLYIKRDIRRTAIYPHRLNAHDQLRRVHLQTRKVSATHKQPDGRCRDGGQTGP